MLNVDYEQLNKRIQEAAEEISKLKYREYIYMISKTSFKELPYINNYNPAPTIARKYSNEELISITLDFYKWLDEDMYKEVLKIITGQSEIPIAVYNDETKNNLLNPISGFCEYSKRPTVENTLETILITDENKEHNVKRSQAKIYAYRKGDCIEKYMEFYILAHEIAHSFAINLNDFFNPTENLLTEVTPIIIEYLMDIYLLKNGLVTEYEVLRKQSREENRNKMTNDEIIFAVMELAKAYKEKGTINECILEQTFRNEEINLNSSRIENICENIIQNKNSIDVSFRYVIANLISVPNFSERYTKNPQEAITRLKEFIGKVKDDDLQGSLKCFDIELTQEGIEHLVEEKKKYRKQLERQLNPRQGEDER